MTPCTDTTVSLDHRRRSRTPERVPGCPVQRAHHARLDHGPRRRFGVRPRTAIPTWDAFETVLGELEGGQALAFASGIAAATAVFDLVPAKAAVVAPRHAYSGTLTQLRERARRGLIDLRLVDIDDTREVLDAAGDAALVWIESPTNPDARDRRHRGDQPRRRRGRHRRGRRQHVRDAAAADVRSTSAPTSSCTRRPSCSPATVTWCSAPSSPTATARCAPSTSAAPTSARSPVRWSAGWPPAACVRCTSASTAPSRTRASCTGASPTRTTSSTPAIPGSARSSRSRSSAAPRSPRSSPSRARSSPTPPASAAWSRRGSAAVAMPAEPTSVPDGLIRFSVGIEDVEDIWSDIERALAAVSRR